MCLVKKLIIIILSPTQTNFHASISVWLGNTSFRCTSFITIYSSLYKEYGIVNNVEDLKMCNQFNILESLYADINPALHKHRGYAGQVWPTVVIQKRFQNKPFHTGKNTPQLATYRCCFCTWISWGTIVGCCGSVRCGHRRGYTSCGCRGDTGRDARWVGHRDRCVDGRVAHCMAQFAILRHMLLLMWLLRLLYLIFGRAVVQVGLGSNLDLGVFTVIGARGQTETI